MKRYTIEIPDGITIHDLVSAIGTCGTYPQTRPHRYYLDKAAQVLEGARLWEPVPEAPTPVDKWSYVATPQFQSEAASPAYGAEAYPLPWWMQSDPELQRRANLIMVDVCRDIDKDIEVKWGPCPPNVARDATGVGAKEPGLASDAVASARQASQEAVEATLAGKGRERFSASKVEPLRSTRQTVFWVVPADLPPEVVGLLIQQEEDSHR